MGTLFPTKSLRSGRLHWPAQKHPGREALQSHSVYAECRATHGPRPWDSSIASAIQQLQEICLLASYMPWQSASLPSSELYLEKQSASHSF